MTRTVVSNDMVAHLWANQSQPAARNASGSFSFRGTYLAARPRHIASIGISAHDNALTFANIFFADRETPPESFLLAKKNALRNGLQGNGLGA
ncbi:MAG: hypothetical protein WC350_06150 [Candidatus Micrarchaeia archaeon]|jgi:hypothetical protein